MKRAWILTGLLLVGCASTAADSDEVRKPEDDAGVRSEIPAPVGEDGSLRETAPSNAQDEDPSGSSESVTPSVESPEVLPTATSPPAPPIGPSTITSTTLPDVEIDLSDLDQLLNELDSLLGSLGVAMTQSEGEFTP